VREGGGRGSVK